MTIIAQCKIEATITIALTEREARSLFDLAAFNPESIVNAINPVSPTWVRDFGPGFATLLERVRKDMGPELDRIKAAKVAFSRDKA